MPRCVLVSSVLLITLFASNLCVATDKSKQKSKEHFLQPHPIHLDRAGKKWADKTLRKMSTDEKIGQLFSIWTRVQFLNEADPIFTDLRDSIRKYHVGSLVMSVPVDGPVLLKSQPYEVAEELNRLQRSSKLPLIVAADFERGLSMRMNGATTFPHAMAFGAAANPQNAEVF
jgi:beta-N-acetylhexosaminidase